MCAGISAFARQCAPNYTMGAVPVLLYVQVSSPVYLLVGCWLRGPAPGSAGSTERVLVVLGLAAVSVHFPVVGTTLY